MNQNTYRNQRPSGGERRSIFALLESIKVERIFKDGLPTQLLLPLLFLAFLGIVYIGNGHLAMKNSRKLEKLNGMVEDLRADYTTLNAEYMYDIKQSEVAKKAKALGLYESVTPPDKIVMKADEF